MPTMKRNTTSTWTTTERSLGAYAVFTPVFSPTISASNQYVHFSFTLDQATQDVDPDVRPQDPVFSNGLSLLWQASFNNGGFGLDAGNMVSVDNVKLEFLGQVPAGLAGDYNNNHIVDAADYTVWRDRLGGTTLPNKSASPGMVDSADYDYWKAHFGATSPGTGLASASGVGADVRAADAVRHTDGTHWGTTASRQALAEILRSALARSLRRTQQKCCRSF